MKKITTLRALFVLPFLFFAKESLASEYTACGNCSSIQGVVQVGGFGSVDGEYDYIVTTQDLKIEIPESEIGIAKMALALNLPLYINSTKPANIYVYNP